MSQDLYDKRIALPKKEPHNDPGSSMDTKTIPMEPKDRYRAL